MKRAALYMRVSTVDQHPETQLFDLRQMAAQRGYQIIREYTDRISGAKAKRPGLDELMRCPPRPHQITTPSIFCSVPLTSVTLA